MNKFWKQFKKVAIALILVVIMSFGTMFSGCFDFDEDNESVNDVLYGVRVSYIRTDYEDGHFVPKADDEFVESLQKQYLNLATEILLCLANEFGKGIDSLSETIGYLTTEYGEITLDSIAYCSPKSESNDYTAITKDETMWAWADRMNVSDSTSPNKYASEFCNSENLFLMQTGLYFINAGTDCSKPGYGSASEMFGKSQDKDTLIEFARNSNVTHTGLIPEEQDLLVDFILNNVIVANSSYYEQTIKDMVKTIFEQPGGSTSDGTQLFKYQVVAGIMVKDYRIQEIAEGAEKEENSTDGETDNEDFFTMPIGHQFYKSIVFMPKTTFDLQGVTLIFESSKEMNITIHARLHEANSDEYLVDAEVGTIAVQAGKYDNVKEPAEFEFSLSDFLKNELGMTDYKIGEYNDSTDVACYGGIAGTGIGDGLFDKYGRALKFSDNEDDKKLASFYNVSKESKYSVGNINFEKKDSYYFEFVFNTDVDAPFNIGYFAFDYEK